MAQYSVYLGLGRSKERSEAVFDRVERNLATRGRVHMKSITDRQYETIRTYDSGRTENPSKVEQLTLF